MTTQDCTIDTHQSLKESTEKFNMSVENLRPWPGQDIVIGECPKCHSTLALELN